jgi:DNA-binding transcriptional LysR family regulator
MNQTTVSRRIEALEHALGLTRFTRTTRGFVLISKGQTLLHKIEAVEVAALDLEVVATRLSRDQSGSTRVAVPKAIVTHLISPIMLAYRSFHPEVRFENLSAEHRFSLKKREADIAFRAIAAGQRINTDPHLQSSFLAAGPVGVPQRVEMVCACPPTNRMDQQWKPLTVRVLRQRHSDPHQASLDLSRPQSSPAFQTSSRPPKNGSILSRLVDRFSKASRCAIQGADAPCRGNGKRIFGRRVQHEFCFPVVSDHRRERQRFQRRRKFSAPGRGGGGTHLS